MLSTSKSRALTAYAVLPLLFEPCTALSHTWERGNTSMVYKWEEITPSPSLHWIPCFDSYACARLIVPLDYSQPSLGNTTIAYMKLPAVNETSSTRNIQINGGGPGVAGTFTVTEAGPTLRRIFGSEYNLVGFDPRGVGESGPSINCFKPGDEEGKKWEAEYTRNVDPKNQHSVANFYEMANAYGKWCADVHRSGDGRYANTVAVAGDMKNFAERDNEAKGLSAEDAKVWYFGGSYGTILGSTFSMLYPDRVGRVILDSNVDADEYYAGRWVSNIDDLDKTVEDFFNKCHAAGPEKCAFWAKSPEHIAKRMEATIESLRARPIPIADRALLEHPFLINYEIVQNGIMLQLFTQDSFPTLAALLKELESRNGTMVAAMYADFIKNGFVKQMDTVFIACLDAAQRLDLSSMEKWEEYIKETVGVSKWLPGTWAGIGGMCSKARDIVPPASQLIDSPIGANHTSNPLLFIGNSIDAATAISHTYKMSSRFPGSTVLEQNFTAHGFFATQSTCMNAHVRTYLKDGIPPPNGTKCDVDAGFGDPFGKK